MHLERSELQLLLLAARSAAWSARAEQDRARLPRLASAEAYERLAIRLETELVRAGPEPSPQPTARTPAEGHAQTIV